MFLMLKILTKESKGGVIIKENGQVDVSYYL